MRLALREKVDDAHEDGIWALAWGGNGPAAILATGSVDENITLWNTDQVKPSNVLKGQQLGVISLDVSSDGSFLLSSGLDCVIRCWDSQSGQSMWAIDSGPLEVWKIALSADNKTIVSGSQSGAVNVFSIKDREKVGSMSTTGESFVMSVAVSPDGRYIASGSKNGLVCIFDAQAMTMVRKTEAHKLPVRSLTFSPDSKVLYSASDDGLVNVTDITSGSTVATLSAHRSWVLSVAAATEGNWLLSGSSDKTAKLWDVRSRQVVQTLEDHKEQVWGVAFSPDGRSAATASDDCALIVYDIDN